MNYIVNDNGVDRTMTIEEQAAYESAVADVLTNAAKRINEQNAIANKRQSATQKLKNLGLTDDEIAALVG